jgi:homoserine O-acetyltransferase
MVSAALVSAALIAVAAAAGAAEFPEPKTSEYVIKDFAFHTGEVMPEMMVSYTTVGEPSGAPVLMLHGTTGSAKSMLSDGFAGALYGPGQALDVTKYFIIIPDAIGTGGSSKPSDGLRAAFPEYNYDDMVAAQYDLVKNTRAAHPKGDWTWRSGLGLPSGAAQVLLDELRQERS